VTWLLVEGDSDARSRARPPQAAAAFIELARFISARVLISRREHTRLRAAIVHRAESLLLSARSGFRSNQGRFPPSEASMQTQVSILHHDYPSWVRETVETKMQHLVKFYDRIVSMRALLERQHAEHRVEIVAAVGRGAVLVVDARGDEFTNALEEAMTRMERLLKRHHDKLSISRRRGR